MCLHEDLANSSAKVMCFCHVSVFTGVWAFGVNGVGRLIHLLFALISSMTVLGNSILLD